MLYNEPLPDNYELFARFSRIDEGGEGTPTLLCEGFVHHRLYRYFEPFSEEYPSKLSFNMSDLNLSRWGELRHMLELEWERNDADFVGFSIDYVLRDVTATVVVVEKATLEAHLVVGSDEFTFEKEDDEGNRTIYGTSDMNSEIHDRSNRLVYDTQNCCLALKWIEGSESKFECHLIVCEI